MPGKVRVAIVGLGFGAEFIPIYQRHPDAELVALCRRDAKELNQVADAFNVPRRYERYEDLLADGDIDAVHINTPIPQHAAQSLAALRACKHVACTVPMATTLDECAAIVEACRRAKRNYMMMETVVFSREFLFVRQMLRDGKLGRLQFLRGSHQQEMAGWPGYWEGLPPMWYATHCVCPLLALCAEAGHSGLAARVRGSVPAASPRTSPTSTAHPSPSRPPPSTSTTRRWPARSHAACSRPPGSTARASTCTGTRPASSGL